MRGTVLVTGMVGLAICALPARAQVLHECDEGGLGPPLRCGTVEVPEDHDDPDSRRIGLNVVIVPAEGPGAEDDPIFSLSGGPGQGATALAPFLARERSPEARPRDVVLVDQRGTGRSNPLSCPLPETPAGYFGGILAPDPALRRCLMEVSRRAEPGLYTTTQSARDLDVVRRTLGYGPVNLSGGSYGTRLAMEFVRRFPDAVRTVTIQGVAPVDFRAPLEYARFAQHALDSLFHDCREDPACAAAFPELDRAWAEVLDRLRDRPAEVAVPGEHGPVGVTYSADDFAYTVRTMLYGPRALGLPLLIHRAWRAGDLAPFAEFYARRAERLWSGLAVGLHLSVFCAEDVPFIEDAEVGPHTTGTFLGIYIIDEYRRGCEIWPRGEIPADFHEPVGSDVPVLILSGRRDPSTPPTTGRRVQEHLPNAVHLVHPWGGHGFQGTPDTSCESEARETLLRTGSTASIDVACAREEKPLPFRLPEEGGAGDGGAAQSADPRPAERARFGTPVLTEVDLDGSGSRVAYVRVDMGGPSPTSRVFVTALDAWPGREVGSGRMPRFRPGSGGDLAFLTSVEGGTAIRIVAETGDAQGQVTAQGGVLDYAWSPDGGRIAFVAPDPDGSPQLFVHDLRSDTTRPVTRLDGVVHTDPFGGGGAFDWAPDGTRIAFAHQEDRAVEGAYRSDIGVVDLESGTVRTPVERPGLDLRPRWSPDGTRIAFATSFGARNRFARHGLAVVDVESRAVTDVPGVDETFLEAPGSHAWGPDGRTLFVTAAEGVATHLHRIDLREGPSTLAGSGPVTVARPRFNADRNAVVYLVSDAGSPWEVRLLALDSGRERVLGRVETEAALPEWELVGWTSAGGHELQGLLYLPRDTADGPAPLVTWLHGGPDGRATSAWDPAVPFPTPSFDPLPLHGLLDQGFAVFLPNHRASAGYAADLRTSVGGRYERVLEEDVLSGIDALVEAGVADPDRLVLGGWASGGMAATQLLTRTGRFRAAVSGAANTSLEAAYGDGDFPAQWHSLMGGPPWARRDAWDAASPLRQAGRIRTPLLLLHGSADSLVPPDQSRYLHTFLRGLGRTVELELLQGVGHGVALPEHRLDVAQRIAGWFQRWTRG